MSDTNGVHVFTTSAMGVLQQCARHKLMDIAIDQNASSCGAISEIVTLPDNNNYILHASNNPVGLGGVAVQHGTQRNITIGSIIISDNPTLDRMDFITLRTSLLYTFVHDNIIIHIDKDSVIDSYINTSVLSSDGVALAIRDVYEECIDIIALRQRKGKKTAITTTPREDYARILRVLRYYTISMHKGTTDYVVHDTFGNRSGDRNERLQESIQQAGVGAVVSVT